MRRPGPELLEEISEGAMYRLGRGISTCLARVADAISAGDAEAAAAAMHGHVMLVSDVALLREDA